MIGPRSLHKALSPGRQSLAFGEKRPMGTSQSRRGTLKTPLCARSTHAYLCLFSELASRSAELHVKSCCVSLFSRVC